MLGDPQQELHYIMIYVYNDRRHRQCNHRHRDQRRAQAHRQRRDDSQFVELLDVVGNRTLVECSSRLPQVHHESVRSALSTRVNIFRGSTIHSRGTEQQQLNGNRIDDTGTVLLNSFSLSIVEARQEEQEYFCSQVQEEMEM